jgi:5-(carboxyamino)imidazole ribonucleotide synthase
MPNSNGNGAIEPGATIGILGGGQLGRMIALAAAPMGYRCHIFCPEPHSPASEVAAVTTVAAYDDHAALEAFAKSVDVVTFEFENIPAATVEFLERHVKVRPGSRALRVSQNRLEEKNFLNDVGVPTTAYAGAASAASLEAAVRHIGMPCLVKTVTEGYDGKGQVRVDATTNLAAAWEQLKTREAIVERMVDFDMECSVIVARGIDGTCVAFAPGENFHVNGILDTTLVPARLPEARQQQAEAIGRHVAEKLELVGVLCVELFVTKDGRFLANEIAPRPHNSGHWTIDACTTSQFEQLVRAICGLPLGAVDRLTNAEMKNLIGDDVAQWRKAVADPNAKLHLYGKRQVRPGRKMGHVTRLLPLHNGRSS